LSLIKQHLKHLRLVITLKNIDETLSKQPKIQRKLKILRKKSMNQTPLDFCLMFVISKKKSISYGMDKKFIENL
jgi:hypothetical protein